MLVGVWLWLKSTWCSRELARGYNCVEFAVAVDELALMKRY